MSKIQLFSMSFRIAILGSYVLGTGGFAQTVEPSQSPFTEGSTPPANILLALSVEFPTANTAAYKSKTFSRVVNYRGYFEANYCYKYMPHGQGDVVEGVDGEYFYPVKRAGLDGVCGGGQWSGRLLNWASMSVLDSFRLSMTGGKRAADTDSETVLRRAWLDARGSDTFSYTSSTSGDSNNFPDKYLSPDVVKDFTGLSGSKGWYIANLDPERYRNSDRGHMPDVKVGDRFRVVEEGEATPYEEGSWHKHRDRYYRVMVKACSTSGLIESFCSEKPYPSGHYKPVGFIQKYANKARFGVFSYPLVDWSDSKGDWSGSNVSQAGGVMRSPLKSMGPDLYSGAAGWGVADNKNAEWDPQTGKLCNSPDDAATLCGSGGIWGRSGSINYINQFGYRQNANGWHYKSGDPIAELYYEALRYYASDYSSGTHGMAKNYLSGDGGRVSVDTKDQQVSDGFPMLIDKWKDPLAIAKCAKNNIVFLGDVNNNCDGRVPGGLFISHPADNIKCPDKSHSGLDEPTGTLNGGADQINVRSLLSTMGGYENKDLVGLDGNSDWLEIACPSGKPGVGRGCWKNMTLNIAGLAYWAHTRDIRPDLKGDQHIDSYFVDVHELAERSQQGTPPAGQDPTQYWYAAKYGAYDLDIAARGGERLNPNRKAPIDPVAGGNTVPSWDIDGNGVPDGWFEGSNPENIKNSFGQVLLRSTQSNSLVTAGIALKSNDLSSNNKIFFPFYKVLNGVWYGDVYGKTVSSDGNEVFTDTKTGALKGAAWSASKQLDTKFDDVWKNGVVQTPGAEKGKGQGRQIITGSTDATKSPIAFQWNALTTTDQTVLSNDGIQANAALGIARVSYIRGDYRQELRFKGNFGFRDRPYGRMGGIVNGAPTYVGIPQEGFSASDFPKNTPSFSNFVKQGRPGMVYVGADDGMLHAFSAEDGSEKFAYIPSMLMDKLPEITKGPGDYQHRLFVDGDSIAANIIAGGAWRTALIGTLGAGGKGFFILDVTNPDTFKDVEGHPESIIKLEVSSARVPEVGYIFNHPARDAQNTYYSVGRAMWDGKPRWVAFLGNGYNPKTSARSSSVALIAVDLEGALNGKGVWNKSLVKVIPITQGWDKGNSNGLSTPTAIDTDYDGVVDTVYAGDLQGNLWKFDLSGGKNGNGGWKVAASNQGARPLFRARSGDNYQPITTAPIVTKGCVEPGYTISFATGSLIDTPAIYSAIPNAVYTILDNTVNPWNIYNVVTKDKLVQQTLTSVTKEYRYSTDKTVPYVSKQGNIQTGSAYGWYMDLASDNKSPSERVIHTPVLYDKYLLFTTYIPAASNSCSIGSGALMALETCSGSRPHSPLFDTNGDGVVDSNDQKGGADSDYASGTIYDGPVTLGDILQGTEVSKVNGRTVEKKKCQLVTSKGSSGFACIPSSQKRISWKEIRQYKR